MKKSLIAGLLMLAAPYTAFADGMPPIPADYPTHRSVGNCVQSDLANRLQAYNEMRLQLASVMRELAEKSDASPESKQRLLGYASSLDDMRHNMPAPDPDSDAFRNFDFRLGIVLTSMTLFLNTEDEHLTERFVHDRDDPNSYLGQYLAKLDLSRESYMEHLAVARSTSAASDCG